MLEKQIKFKMTKLRVCVAVLVLLIPLSHLGWIIDMVNESSVEGFVLRKKYSILTVSAITDNVLATKGRFVTLVSDQLCN